MQPNDRTLAHLQKAIMEAHPHFIVLNKPAGLAVQGGTNQKDALSWYLKDQLCPGEELYIVHRLDQETQGLLLLARSLEAARFYTNALQQRTIKKTYHAIVLGCPKKANGTVRAAIGKGLGTQGRELMFVDNQAGRKLIDLKEAVTHYEVLKTSANNDQSLLRLQIETGRKHQIRVHLSQVLKTPILNDRKYGGKNLGTTQENKELRLIATELSFQDLCGTQRHIKCPIPEHFLKNFT